MQHDTIEYRRVTLASAWVQWTRNISRLTKSQEDAEDGLANKKWQTVVSESWIDWEIQIFNFAHAYAAGGHISTRPQMTVFINFGVLK